jgi:hypothetical protein
LPLQHSPFTVHVAPDVAQVDVSTQTAFVQTRGAQQKKALPSHGSAWAWHDDAQTPLMQTPEQQDSLDEHCPSSGMHAQAPLVHVPEQQSVAVWQVAERSPQAQRELAPQPAFEQQSAFVRQNPSAVAQAQSPFEQSSGKQSVLDVHASPTASQPPHVSVHEEGSASQSPDATPAQHALSRQCVLEQTEPVVPATSVPSERQ